MGARLIPDVVRQAMQLGLAAPGLKAREILSVDIIEAVHQHPILTAQVRVAGGPRAAVGTLGLPLEAGIFDGRSFQVHFSGTVEECDLAGRILTFTALGHSHGRDKAIRTRQFGDAAGPTPAARLLGMADVLEGIENSSRLSIPIQLVTQWNCSDYALVKRLADLHGLMLVSLANGSMRLTDGKDGPRMKIPSSAIHDGSERVWASRGWAGTVDVATWDLHQGQFAKTSARSSPRASRSKTLEAGLARLCTTGGLIEIRSTRCGIGQDDAETVDAIERSLAGGLFRFQAALGYSERGIGLCTRLRITGHPIPDELLVVRRRLSYRPGGGSVRDQFRNEIECVPVSRPPVASPRPMPGPVTPVLGRVTSIGDPAGMLRVKVEFPWHVGRSSGVWCPVPQSFGGDAAGRYAGAVDLPSIGDMVMGLVDPLSFDSPTVLGSVCAGLVGGRKPGRPSPEDTRVLFRSADGVELRVSGGGGKSSGATLRVVSADDTPKCQLTLSGDGSITLSGDSLAIDARKVTVSGPTTVAGSLHVTKVSS
jgi:hypothetical protein